MNELSGLWAVIKYSNMSCDRENQSLGFLTRSDTGLLHVTVARFEWKIYFQLKYPEVDAYEEDHSL